MLRTIASSAILSLLSLPSPAEAEIVKAECKLEKYGDNALAEIFPCHFRQNLGNVQVWSKSWNFEFLAAERGKSYVRINTNPLSFHRVGRYSLFIYQTGMPTTKITR